MITFGDDTYVDQLCPSSMASTDVNAGESVSNDKYLFHESSLQSSTETVPITPES